MRSLVYLVAMTMDGCIASVDRGDPDFFPFEGPHVADLLAEFPEMIPGHLRGRIGLEGVANQRFDTVLMGRTTYGIGEATGVRSPYPHLQQYVVSRSLTVRPDPDVELIRGDVVRRVRELKALGGKDIWLCGGGALAAQLVDEIDELILKVSPVFLGEGVPLFDGPIGARRVAITNQTSYPNGFTLVRGRWAA